MCSVFEINFNKKKKKKCNFYLHNILKLIDLNVNYEIIESIVV